MQWQFRKSIESFQAYKRTNTIKNQIENGNQSTLNTVAREIQIILNDKSQKIITKVLALRFVRDVMILGQEDVVKRVQKLIPILVKICSFQLNSSDPDRGQTFFHDHASYLKMTDEDEKKQIDTLGSTFLILSLESIFHWAKWIPYNNNGQQSIYAKAYQSLVDRDVKFPTAFHYYKQSDTEKFKNMYKMEFFTDSYQSAYSQSQSKLNQSESSIDNHSKNERSSRNRQEQKFSQGIVEQYTGNARNLRNVNELLVFLNEMRVNKTRKMGDLKQVHKKVQEMYENKQSYQKEQRKWFQSYIINFSMLNSNFITYEQFLQRCVSQQIQLDQPQQQQISIYNPKEKITNRTPLKVNEANKSLLRDSNIDKNEDLLKKQEFQYKTKLNSVFLQLQEKHNEIMVLKSNYQKEKSKIIEDYQSRLISIKQEVRKSQQDKGSFQKQLQKENEKLKTKLATIQQEMTLFNYNTSRQRDLQSERNQLLTKVKKLQIENEKLNQAKSTKNIYEKEVVQLETGSKEKDALIEKMKAELKKSQKQVQNYLDEAGLYKSQLINERNKHDQKMQTLSKSKETFGQENKSLKEKVLQLRKNLDLKQIQILNLRQQAKRFQNKLKDMSEKKDDAIYNKSQQFMKSKTNQFLSPGKLLSPSQQDTPHTNFFANEKNLKYNNYEDLYIELKPINKELFIRLCRCGLKKKDILLKENQLQIGIISQVLSDQKVKFILHFTNTSEKQIENLKIDYTIPQSYLSTLDYQIDNKYIFCIQPQEQEKVTVIITNKEPPFLKERAILEISYEKNGFFLNSNLFLPFFITKFFDFYKPKPANLVPQRSKNRRETLIMKYNRKMIPKPVAIKSFFQDAEQTSQNKFQVQAVHRQTETLLRLTLQVNVQNQTIRIEVLTVKEKQNDKQRYIFQELFSFLQSAFKK